ncbi:hypothetical protein E2562_039286 [Oryza meyeriana var. granulata]|uniref:Uncharacterized protein n=1 Tax=Oryza meyeriana var. granulata TaxID=110450 RepID=A0A6G1DUI2_9ORYZ|nr:hypothetical protein E2562_039286 [Oryza meyeriana var. granulata]
MWMKRRPRWWRRRLGGGGGERGGGGWDISHTADGGAWEEAAPAWSWEGREGGSLLSSPMAMRRVVQDIGKLVKVITKANVIEFLMEKGKTDDNKKQDGKECPQQTSTEKAGGHGSDANLERQMKSEAEETGGSPWKWALVATMLVASRGVLWGSRDLEWRLVHAWRSSDEGYSWCSRMHQIMFTASHLTAVTGPNDQPGAALDASPAPATPLLLTTVNMPPPPLPAPEPVLHPADA